MIYSKYITIQRARKSCLIKHHALLWGSTLKRFFRETAYGHIPFVGLSEFCTLAASVGRASCSRVQQYLLLSALKHALQQPARSDTL